MSSVMTLWKYPRIQLLTVKEILEEKRESLTPSKIGSKIATGQTNLLSY